MEELKFPMHSQSKLYSRLALLAFTLPLSGFCANLGTSISANGTCEYGGTCPQADTPTTAVGVGQSSSDSFTFFYTFADGDKYKITGSYFNYYPPQELAFLPNVVYDGTTPSAGADSLSLIMYQAFYDTHVSPWDGNYCETVAPFSIPSGDSVSGIVTFDGNAGLGSQPGNSSKHCAPLSFTALQNGSDYMDTAYDLTFNFAAGSAPGSGIVSTPEPAQTIPAALSLIGLLAFVRARKSRS
jgi:hypothetical protein